MYCELRTVGCERAVCLFVCLFYRNIGLMKPSDMMNSEADRVRKEVVMTAYGGFLTEVRVERS